MFVLSTYYVRERKLQCKMYNVHVTMYTVNVQCML